MVAILGALSQLIERIDEKWRIRRVVEGCMRVSGMWEGLLLFCNSRLSVLFTEEREGRTREEGKEDKKSCDQEKGLLHGWNKIGGMKWILKVREAGKRGMVLT